MAYQGGASSRPYGLVCKTTMHVLGRGKLAPNKRQDKAMLAIALPSTRPRPYG